ncbi:MAG: RHS repeat-associated core domain-containing protein, partial [Planctomycetaceae bacterium]|nr:RHS repeat-associated core domain-containing protein [Planctomycetaceae bacterium]
QDELICDNDNWTLGDHLNTIRDIVKSDGNVAYHLDYNAFGRLISVTKNDNLSFAYTGKLFDQMSDLQWNISRWYDSNVGRWMSVDPIGFEGGDINLFKYVHNIPVLFADFLGLETSDPCTSNSGKNETCKQIVRPVKEAEAERTYIGEKFTLYHLAYLSYYMSKKWVSEGSAVTSACSQKLETSQSIFVGQEITYSLGGLVNAGTEILEISGTVAFSVTTGTTKTQTFSQAAKRCRYYKGYLARLKITIEYYVPGYLRGMPPPAPPMWMPPYYGISKVLYEDTGPYICECTCSN